MKKINWFTRTFMSWTALTEYIRSDAPSSNDELITLQVENKNLNIRLVEHQNNLLDKAKQLEEKQNDVTKLIEKLSKAENEKKVIEESSVLRKEELIKKDSLIKSLNESIIERKNDLDVSMKSINEKLIPLSRIQKTFFGEAGNKGKGELGEMQVKSILEKSGLESDMWMENLLVGDKQVEFAIKSGHNDKWIPVDSKVLDTSIVDGKIVIDKDYASRVKTQVKEITKYLSKSNTADYGLLVLQNDSIYMELFDSNPLLFQEMIRKHKVYICSPSSFVQFAWSVSHILDIYERVHNDEKIYDQMIDALTTITKLSSSLVKVHKDFNIAMNTHYPTLQSRQIKLQKKLSKDGKIKELNSIELSD